MIYYYSVGDFQSTQELLQRRGSKQAGTKKELESCQAKKRSLMQYHREGGSWGKFPGPGSQEGPAKSLIQKGELNNMLMGLKLPLASAPPLLQKGPCCL